jgi:ribonuclease E
MKKEMLINVLQPEECRIAIVEDGVLEELYVERTSHESYVGNIYKGRIVNIEPSIQAAFVDFGVGRNGFLHVSDVEPTYYRHLEQRQDDRRGRPRDRAGDRDRRPGGDRGRRRPDRDEAEEAPRPRPASRHEEDEPARPRLPLSGADMAPVDTFDTRSEEQHGNLGWEAVDSPDLETDRPGHAPVEPPPAVEDAETPAGGGEPEKPREGSRGRGRKRSRGGARRRRPADAAAKENDAAPADAAQEPPAANVPEPDVDALRERPRLMDSAERRTEEEDGDEMSIDSASAESGGSPMLDDDDIFFPRSEDDLGAEEPVRPLRSEIVEEVEVETEADVEVEVQDEEEVDEHYPETPFDDEEEDDAFGEFDDFDEGPEPQRTSRQDSRRGGPRGRGRRFGGGRSPFGRPKPLIQDIFKRGQEVIVQVIKEGIGTKGPTLSTYISIAGRYLVLMPSLSRVGVSRKIRDEEQRRRLRDIFNEMQPPKGLGFIIRTAAIDRNKKELQSDLVYLTRLWQVVVRRIRKIKGPAEIYQESDMITRTIRDTFTRDIGAIWVDEPTAFQHAQEFLKEVLPRYVDRLKLHDSPEPLFHKYGIESEIARIQRRHVPLPTGGSIVIDQTEALVAIDVNSGNFRADNNAEETAYQMNLQAAREIARQLRLRDLGGVIVNDFIDMRDDLHRRGVEKALRDAVKRDRARTKILKISQFGIIEMTRQRIRPSLKRSVYQDCPHCLSTGQVKTVESMSIDVMRMIQLAAHKANVHRIQIRTAQEVSNYLLNKKRKEIAHLEEAGQLSVHIEGLIGVAPEMLEFTCRDNRDNEIKVIEVEDRRSGRR